ncbi:hypothetical protein CLU79DRAFT_703979 [Phycomyces nitens]|nr:hypothetical protein CLU79DRAFT_703979 [Phycomyces nitens]
MESTNALVPDASSEHPLVVSHAEDQPVCYPNIMIQPSHQIKTLEGYESIVLTNAINRPRKLILDHVDHLLVISGSTGLYSIRMDECGNPNVILLIDRSSIENQDFAHGLAQYADHIYITTPSSVWQFPYVDGQHTPLSNGVKVLDNINIDDDSAQPDIAIDPFGYAYIPRTVTELNERTEPGHAIIKRFNFRQIPVDGYDFDNDGQVHAIGANSHGSMSFDAQARLWGIEAPLGTVEREDLGGDITEKGLAGEINLYEFPMENYGFPYCFTEYDLSSYTVNGLGKGTQWGHPMFMNETMDLDSFCQTTDNSQQPAFPLTSPSNAIAVNFYMGESCSVGDLESLGTSVGMPCNWTDTPIVAYHGREGHSEGHSVVHLGMDDLGHRPRWDKKEEIIFEAAEPCSSDDLPCISPVGLGIDSFGRLFISSDDSNEIFRVNRIYNPKAAQELTDKDNAKEAAADAAADAKEDAEMEAKEQAQEQAEEDAVDAADDAREAKEDKKEKEDSADIPNKAKKDDADTDASANADDDVDPIDAADDAMEAKEDKKEREQELKDDLEMDSAKPKFSNV